MKRDKYFEAELEWFALNERYDRNDAAQRALGWIDLEIPRFIGYKKSLTLRSDIENREDAWVFQEIIKKFGTSPTSRKKDFLFYDPTLRKKVTLRAGIRDIRPTEYEQLAPQVKKWFSLNLHKVSTWNASYWCTVPRFFFDEKVEKNYCTKVRVHDELLAQEKAEIEKAMRSNPLFNKVDDYWYGDNWNAPKWYRRHRNRSEKMKAKAALTRFIKEGDDPDISPNYKDASNYW